MLQLVHKTKYIGEDNMITLIELLKNEELNSIKFATSNKNLNKNVKDITVMEVPEVCKWLHGNELVITSLYAVKDSIESQIELIEDLNEVNCSGLLVKLGPHVKYLDSRVIDKAEELQMPILIIPENMTYVDIIGKVMRIITRAEEDAITVENIIFKLLCGNDLEINEVSELERVFDINDIGELYFWVFAELTNNKDRVVNINNRNIYKIQIGDFNLVTLIDKDAELLKKYKKELKNNICKENEILLILGKIAKGISNLKEELIKIEGLIEEIKTFNKFPKNVYSIESCKEEILREKYTKTHGKSIYTNYLKELSDEEIITLKTFIDNSSNITKTAKDMFLHKNTVRYRINTISEKTGLDPFKFDDALKFYYGIKYLENR